MIWSFGIGPQEKWQNDLSKLSKDALICVVKELAFIGRYNSERLVEMIASNKTIGRSISASRRYHAFVADPDKAIEQSLRRQLSAKVAARRKKRRTA